MTRHCSFFQSQDRPITAQAGFAKTPRLQLQVLAVLAVSHHSSKPVVVPKDFHGSVPEGKAGFSKYTIMHLSDCSSLLSGGNKCLRAKSRCSSFNPWPSAMDVTLSNHLGQTRWSFKE